MGSMKLSGVTEVDALNFFFKRLKRVSSHANPPDAEVLYNASVLAHFATRSTASMDSFPSCPASLGHVFDLYVLDKSMHNDGEVLEGAGSQCLLLTGFFMRQQVGRYNISWYTDLGMQFYTRASRRMNDDARASMLATMAERFRFWRNQQARLARAFEEDRYLIRAMES